MVCQDSNVNGCRMSDQDDITKRALETLNEAVEKFQKAQGTPEERLELVEALIGSTMRSIGEMATSVSQLSKSILVLGAGLQSLGERVQTLERTVAQSLVTPPTSFSPKDAN